MATNTTRSMNAELAEGRSDGVLMKPVQNRGGEVDAATRRSRQDLHAERGYGRIGSNPPPHMTGEEAIPR